MGNGPENNLQNQNCLYYIFYVIPVMSVLKNDFKSSGEISLFATTGRNFDLLRFVLFHVRSTTLKLCKIMEIYVGGGAV